MKKIASFLIFLLLLLVSCKKNDNAFSSRITLLNAGINASTFTIRLNNDTTISNAAYGVLRPYRTVPSGTFNINFLAGTSTTPVVSFTSNLESGSNYISLVYDSTSKTKLFFQKETVPTSVTDGKCAIRFFSLVPSSTGLYFGIDTVGKGSRTLLSGYAFNTYANTFVESDTTSLMLKLKMSGISAALDSINKPLANGKIYTIFLIGALNATGTNKPKLLFIDHN